jgi:hypothetical protein
LNLLDLDPTARYSSCSHGARSAGQSPAAGSIPALTWARDGLVEVQILTWPSTSIFSLHVIRMAIIMGSISIACYRPKPGMSDRLLELTRHHVPRLRARGLATNRTPIAMVAADGTVVEVFEWQSDAAIAAAHQDPEVQVMWQEYNQVCEYVPLSSLAEAGNLFAGFKPIDVAE